MCFKRSTSSCSAADNKPGIDLALRGRLDGQLIDDPAYAGDTGNRLNRRSLLMRVLHATRESHQPFARLNGQFGLRAKSACRELAIHTSRNSIVIYLLHRQLLRG